MSQPSHDLIDGIRQAESIQVAAIDVLRELASLMVSTSAIVPGGDRWVPALDRAVATGFGTVTSLVHLQYSVGVRALEAIAPMVPVGLPQR
jgi:hypothetical protein